MLACLAAVRAVLWLRPTRVRRPLHLSWARRGRVSAEQLLVVDGKVTKRAAIRLDCSHRTTPRCGALSLAALS